MRNTFMAPQQRNFGLKTILRVPSWKESSCTSMCTSAIRRLLFHLISMTYEKTV